jgi:hypothetical protein
VTNWRLYAIAVLIWGSTWFAIDFQLGVGVFHRDAVDTQVVGQFAHGGQAHLGGQAAR